MWDNNHTPLGSNLGYNVLKIPRVNLRGEEKPSYLTFLSHYFSTDDNLKIFGFIMFSFLGTLYRVMVSYGNAIKAFPPGNPDDLLWFKDAIVRIFGMNMQVDSYFVVPYW